MSEIFKWIISILYVAIAVGVIHYSYDRYRTAWVPKKREEKAEDEIGVTIAATFTGIFWPISLIAHLIYLFLKSLTKKRSS